MQLKKSTRIFAILGLFFASSYTINAFANTVGTWTINNQSSLSLSPNTGKYIQAPSGCVQVSQQTIPSKEAGTLTVTVPDDVSNCPTNYDFSIFYLYPNGDGTSTNCQLYATMKKESGKYNLFVNANLASYCMANPSKLTITPGGSTNNLNYLVKDAK